jgi:hypothetical protein
MVGVAVGSVIEDRDHPAELGHAVDLHN